MKLLAILSVAFAVASADSSVDWSTVKPVTEIEGFWDIHDRTLFNSPNTFATIKRNGNGRIVNGEIAAPHQFPYQVALLTTFGTAGTGLCGGSVISDHAILTAAHCSDARATQFRIIAGAVNRVQDEPTQQIRLVAPSGWIQHPQYNQNNLANDIAVIIWNGNPFTLNTAVQIVQLSSDRANTHAGSEVYVSGFGRFSDSESAASDVLRFTRKTVITNTACRVRFPFLIQESTICAIGDSAINNSVCNGDSGGPLTIRDAGGRSVQVGVVSFGSPLGCERDWPDGYARVSHFYDWIGTTGAL